VFQSKFTRQKSYTDSYKQKMQKSIHQRVGIVTVSYISDQILPNLLRSIPENVECIIVDNAPPERSLNLNLFDYPSIKISIERPSGELGFGSACNLGARHSEKEFIFFVNPDSIISESCIKELLKAMDTNPNACAANPQIINSTGRLEFKYRSALLPKSEWEVSKTPPSVISEMPVLTGAALLVRRSSFEAVGGFDENIFLYHEDDDLSIRMRKSQGKLIYVPKALAHHDSGSSSSRSPLIAFRKAFFMSQSKMYAQEKHGFKWVRTKNRIVACLGIFSPINLGSARKLAKSLGFLCGAFLPRTRKQS